MIRFALVLLLATVATPAFAGTITLSLGGSPVTVTTTGDHNFAVADAVAKVNVQIAEQNVRNQADNDAAIAAWNAENARRAALTPPLDPLPAPALKTISPTLTREQWVSEQVRSVLDGLGKSYRDRMLGTARDAFYAVPAESKTAVCAALGLTGKLPECP